jgi:hypothetical protein
MTGWMQKDGLRDTARLVGCTAGMALVVALYLLVPLLLVLGPFIPETSSRLLVALGILAAFELAVVRVLVHTTRLGERRIAGPRPVLSRLKNAGMRARSGSVRFRLAGRAVGAVLLTSIVFGLIEVSPALNVLADAGSQAGPMPALAIGADTRPLEQF